MWCAKVSVASLNSHRLKALGETNGLKVQIRVKDPLSKSAFALKSILCTFQNCIR